MYAINSCYKLPCYIDFFVFFSYFLIVARSRRSVGLHFVRTKIVTTTLLGLQKAPSNFLLIALKRTCSSILIHFPCKGLLTTYVLIADDIVFGSPDQCAAQRCNSTSSGPIPKNLISMKYLSLDYWIMVQTMSWLVVANKSIIIFFTYHAEIHQDDGWLCWDWWYIW